MKLVLLEEAKKIVVLNESHDEIQKQIVAELTADKYNSIVTMYNFKVMKEASQELGKTSKFISDFRIAKKKSEMGDIDLFNNNLVGYCKNIDAKQTEIKNGLSIFEEETRKQIVNLCTLYLQDCYLGFQIREEFQNIDVSDMTQSGYMTPKGAITSKGKAEIEARINLKLAFQAKIDNRLLQLENECLNAKIEPLTIEHIESFLYNEDEYYKNKLAILINAEVSRNKRIEETAKIEAEKVAAEKHIQDRKIFLNEKHLPLDPNITTADMVKINYEIQNEPLGSKKDLVNQLTLAEMRIEQSKENETETINEESQEQHMKEIVQKKAIVKEHIKTTPATVKTLGKDKDNETIIKKVTVQFDLELPSAYINKNIEISNIYKKRFNEQLKGGFKNLIVGVL